MGDRYSLPEVPEIEMNANNKKLQEVLGYFNQRVERAPCTYLVCNGGDCVEGYTLALDTDKYIGNGNFYRGPRGLAVDLDISYERALSEGSPMDSVRATFPLARPGFLQDALARRNLVADLSVKFDNGNKDTVSYEIVGDRVRDMAFGEIGELAKIPNEYIQLMNNIKKGTNARKAVDLAVDLWEWDNGM